MSEDDTGSLLSVSRGAGLFFTGKVISNGIGLVTNLILTRILGSSLYGSFAYLSVVLGFVRVLTQLGSGMSMLRYLPDFREEPTKQRMVLTLAYSTSFIASIVAAIGVFWFAPVISRYTISDPLFTEILRIVAIVIPFNTLSNITLSVFRGVERMDYHVGVSSIAEPLLRLLFVGGAVLLGYSIVGAVAGLIVTGIVVFALGLIVLRRRIDFAGVAKPTKAEAKSYYNFSVPLTFTQIGSFLYNQIDILMIGVLLTGSAVGIYRISVVLAGFLILPLAAFNQLFPSVSSKLYQNKQQAELRDVYRTVTRWTVTATLFPTVVIMMYAEEILRVFGADFTKGALVLVLLALAKFVSGAVGPSGVLLMMSDHQYVNLLNQTSAGLLNAVLNYVFLLEFGFIGAALATASVLISINIARLAELWYFEKIQPYDRAYCKPIIATLVSIVPLFLASLWLSQYSLLLIGTGIGFATYLCLLYLLGIESEEIELFKRLIH
jgi:O-antigen/teichoic acid export membrane protein